MQIQPMQITHPRVDFTDAEMLLVAAFLRRKDEFDLADGFMRKDYYLELDPDGISGESQYTYFTNRCRFVPLYGHDSGGRIWDFTDIKRYIDTHKEV